MARRSNLLHSALDEAIGEMPRQALLKIVGAKLQGLGFGDKPEFVSALVDHALSKSSQPLEWDDPELENLELEITEDDLHAMRVAQDELVATVPLLVEGVLETASKEFARRLRSDWTTREVQIEADHAGFLIRLRHRWGAPLSRLRMLISMCFDVGARSASALRRSKSRRNRYLREVLVRLHARACQVASEVVCLLEGGFADGAMARWRTLHELAVVARFIQMHGEETAERYLAYDLIEARSEFLLNKRTALAIGAPPPSAADEAKLEAEVQQARDRYGANFSNNYGWAAKALDRAKPTFDILQTAVGRADAGPYFKFASQNVHAGVRGLQFRLGQFGGTTMLAGPSNAGLEQPGQLTAQSIAVITQILLSSRVIDDVAWMKALSNVSAEVGRLFNRCRRKLEKEQAATEAGSRPIMQT